MGNREYFNLEPLGVLAVERTQDCVVSLRRQAAELGRRAHAVEAEARKAEDQTLAALSVELGVKLPPGATFRLVGSVLEVTWEGARTLVFGDPEPEQQPAAEEVTPDENEEPAAEEATPAETAQEPVTA